NPAHWSNIPSFRIRGDAMATQMTKSQLLEKLATITELSKRDVKHVMDTLTDVGHKELKKNGIFLVPGFAKFVVVKKPATKARKGTNPFTGEEMMFKAKPARKIVRARPVKAAKDAVERKGPQYGGLLFQCLKVPQEESNSNRRSMRWSSRL